MKRVKKKIWEGDGAERRERWESEKREGKDKKKKG